MVFDFSASSSLGGGVTVSSPPTGSGAPVGTNRVFGYAVIKDTGGTVGIATLSGSDHIVPLSPASLTLLSASSNNAATDYTTAGIASPLAWSNGITVRSVNSLTFDTVGGNQIVNMGAVGNTLTISSGALGFTGVNNGTLLGGQVGASGSEVFVHQNGAGTLSINSPVSGGAGSLVKFGAATSTTSAA